MSQEREITWCHGNTQRNHAFQRAPGGVLKGQRSLCGSVVHPGEIKLYGLLGDSRCEDCKAEAP